MTKIWSKLPQEHAVKPSDKVYNYWTKLVSYVAVYLCLFVSNQAMPIRSLDPLSDPPLRILA